MLLNGRRVADRRIDGSETLTETLSPPYHQAAFNVVALDFRYRPRAAQGDRYDELAHNQLGEMTLASPAAAGDRLYVRTLTKLYCLR